MKNLIQRGKLGKKWSSRNGKYVYAQHCTFTQTQNGARIKTWQVKKEPRHI